MKRVHAIVVILVALTLMMPSFSSLVSAQTVWRDGEQFKVVNFNQIVLFNISNVSIPIPTDAKDINVTIHARFRLLRAPDIVNVKAFVCEVNSNNVVLTLSSSGSKRMILNAHMKPNKLSNWNVTFCPEDICSNTLDVNLTLVNVSPIDGSVKISNAYVVLSNRSSSLEVLIPTRDFIGVTVVYRRENITFRNEVKNVSSQNPPQNNNSTPWAGIIGGGILLVILIGIIVFCFPYDTIPSLFSYNLEKNCYERKKRKQGETKKHPGKLEKILDKLNKLLNMLLDMANKLNNILNEYKNVLIVIIIIICFNGLILFLYIRSVWDLAALLFIYSFFGVPLTFSIIGGDDEFVLGVFSAIGIFIASLVLVLLGLTRYHLFILVGFSILAVFGYAVIFIQIQLKTLFKSCLDTEKNKNNDNNSDNPRYMDMITQAINELDTFFDILAGGTIAAGSTVLALSFSSALLESENFNWMKVIQKAIGSIFIFYIGILILSISLLRADDVLRRTRSQPPRLTIQNAIAMLLILLGTGLASILELNNHNGLACIIFLLEAVPGILLLVSSNRRN